LNSKGARPVSRVGPDAEAGGDLPHLDGLVPAGGEDVVAAGQEGHAAHVVVVTVHSLKEKYHSYFCHTVQYFEVPLLHFTGVKSNNVAKLHQ
jgi:hypothetical protein